MCENNSIADCRLFLLILLVVVHIKLDFIYLYENESMQIEICINSLEIEHASGLHLSLGPLQRQE